MKEATTERRQYFRVDDEVAVTICAWNDDYGGETVPNERPDLQIEYQASLELQLRQALSDIRAKYAEVAIALDLINQKINLLHHEQQVDRVKPTLKPASLSACGIALTWPESYCVGERLQLFLFLQPLHQLVQTTAYVIECSDMQSQDDGERFLLRLNFDNIHVQYQELLIQHVVRRQSEQLRKRNGIEDASV